MFDKSYKASLFNYSQYINNLSVAQKRPVAYQQ